MGFSFEVEVILKSSFLPFGMSDKENYDIARGLTGVLPPTLTSSSFLYRLKKVQVLVQFLQFDTHGLRFHFHLRHDLRRGLFNEFPL